MKLLGTLAIFAMMPLCLAEATCASIIYDQTPSEHFSGANAKGSVIADDFTLDADATITHLLFWMFEGSSNLWDGTVEYFVFDNSPGAEMPTSSPLAFGLGQNITRTLTGFSVAGGSPEYEVWLELESPVSLSGGTQYWLGLHLMADFSSPDAGPHADAVGWSRVVGAGSFGSEGLRSTGGTFDNWTDPFSSNQDYVFQLHDMSTAVIPEPSSMTLWSVLGVAFAATARRRRRIAQV